MASENETVAEIRKDVHDYLTSIGPGEYPSEDQFEEFADRFETAHKREVAELRRCLQEAVDAHCGKCPLWRRAVCHMKGASSLCRGVDGWRRALEGGSSEERTD